VVSFTTEFGNERLPGSAVRRAFRDDMVYRLVYVVSAVRAFWRFSAADAEEVVIESDMAGA